MSNALTEEKRQQVLALGRLGWPLRRIEQETGVRRETASAYLKAAGIAIRPPRNWGKHGPGSKPANGASEVSPDFGGDFAASEATSEASPAQASSPPDSKPAGQSEIRRILGITSLARKHGAALADDACAAALDCGIPANPYRFVRLWLERKTPLTLVQVDPIIRQLTLYRDLIDQKTQENEE